MNVGASGTGLSFRQKIGGAHGSRQTLQAKGGSGKQSVTIEVNDDGSLNIHDGNGNALPKNVISLVKKNARSHIMGLLSTSCAKFNAISSDATEVHYKTPSPEYSASYDPKEFDELAPLCPPMKKPGLLGLFMKSREAKVEAENKTILEAHSKRVADWEKRKASFDHAELDQKAKVEFRIHHDLDVMDEALEEAFCGIDWPRETLISFDIFDEGKRLFLDVDLPEIEDMPTKAATVQERNLRLGIKDMSDAQVRRLYMQHIHGIGFRLIGEAFSALPTLEDVIISAFSQRTEAATGNVVDEYLYSLTVTREQWSHLNFKKLGAIDPVEALDQFDLRRKMTKTGVFKPIEPFTAA